MAVVLTLAATLVARTVARRIGEAPFTVFLWLAAWSLVIACTLTPAGHLEIADPQVISTRGPWLWSLPNPSAFVSSINWQSMNLLLFLPLGIATGLLRGSSSVIWGLAIGTLTSFAVEVVQYLMPVLGRSQFNFATVIIGWIGIIFGCGIGLVLSRLFASVWRRARRPSSTPGVRSGSRGAR